MVPRWQQHHLIPLERQRQRTGKLSLGEMLFIMVLFHLGPNKDFKHFRRYGVEQEFRHCFAERPAYGRFVALMPRLLLPLSLVLHCGRGQTAGIYCVDSTRPAVCHNAPISGNRVLWGWLNGGRTAMGWCFGFKLHLLTTRAGSWPSRQCRDRQPLERITAALRGR